MEEDIVADGEDYVGPEVNAVAIQKNDAENCIASINPSRADFVVYSGVLLFARYDYAVARNVSTRCVAAVDRAPTVRDVFVALAASSVPCDALSVFDPVA